MHTFMKITQLEFNFLFRCETVGLLLQCTVEEARKRNIKNVSYTLHLFTHMRYGAANSIHLF